jgi:flagellar motor switch protein FliG
VHVDTDAYVRSVLTKALGDDKASNLISRILQPGDTNGIEGLKWMDAPTVADLIRTSTRRSSPRFSSISPTITPATS